MKAKGIMAYGTDEDREKLAVLAHLSGKSQSEWLINTIRQSYKNAFGDTPPQHIITPLGDKY